MGFNWSFFARNHAHKGVEKDGSPQIDYTDIAGLLSRIVPTGAMLPFAGSVAPDGTLLCDGGAYSRTTYAALFAVCGTTFGAGDGSTTFNVPDTRGIYLKGAGTTNRAAGKDSAGNYYTATLGAYTTDQFQSHFHGTQFYGNAGGALTRYAHAVSATSQLITDSAGGTDKAIDEIVNGTYGTPRKGYTTEPQALAVNHIIKT